MTDTTTEAVGRLIASATSEPWEVDACNMMAALAQERDALAKRIAWLEEIREGAGRALCEADGIAPDEPIADGGHVAWQLHVYQRAHAALAAKRDKQ